MRKTFFASACIFLFSLNIYAENISGRWHGVLNKYNERVQVSLEIKRSGNSGYTAMFNRSDWEMEDVGVTSVSFISPDFQFKIIEYAVEYSGILGGDGIIRGIFRQKSLPFNLNLTKDEIKREQEPLKPYPYIEEDVRFENKKAGILLAGTLTIPEGKGPFPSVVLVSAMGPHNRNGEMYGHKPFLVIADYLTKNGIAVLRYDDRGTAHSSGDFKSATTLDFAGDAEAALDYLKTRKEINVKKIGITGYGEEAAAAAIIAAEHKDISFLVLLAGTGIQGKEFILKQKKATGKAYKIKSKALKRDLRINKKAIEIALNSENIGEIRSSIMNYTKKTYEGFKPNELPEGTGKVDFMRMYANAYANPWMLYFLKHDPAETLKKVECPVLALGGGKDLKVNAKENLKAIKKALEEGGNKDVTVKIFSGLNYLFQKAETGLPSEYYHIEETFSPEVLSEISQWIGERTK